MIVEFPTTAGVLCQVLDGRLVGDSESLVSGLVSFRDLKTGQLSYLSDKKYAVDLKQKRGGVLLTYAEWVDDTLPLTYLVVSEPKQAFAKIAGALGDPTPWEGISPLAFVHAGACIADGASIGPMVVVERGAKVGRGCIIYPHSYLGDGVEIGEYCLIHPNVTILPRVRIGNRVKIFSGAVIGSDGFGYFQSTAGGPSVEMPQVGSVEIEDDVRIGAHTTIDRGTLGQTCIGARTKLDDHVHIAHNCRIGMDCLICAFVGLAGSVTVEDGVMMGGQVGVSDHVTIGRGAKIAAQSGVGTDLEGNRSYFLSPAVPQTEALRIVRYWKRLPELWKKVRELEKLVTKY